MYTKINLNFPKLYYNNVTEYILIQYTPHQYYTKMYKIYTQEPEYNKETITAKELSKLAGRSRKLKIYNPKTNRMIAIDGPTYNKLIRDGYMHWEEEGLLIPPSPFEEYI